VWVKSTPNAVNKLPNFLKEQHVKEKADSEKQEQSTITDHFGKAGLKEVVIPYSDDDFKQAAMEWLVATDQVCNHFICHS